MKTLVLRNIVILIILTIMFPVVLQAQVDVDIELPQDIPQDIPRDSLADLNRRRGELLDQFNELALRIHDHNSRCVKIPGSNKALLKECQSNFIQLRSDIASYSTRTNAFGIAVNRAVEEPKVKKKILNELKDGSDPSKSSGLSLMKPYMPNKVSKQAQPRRMSLLEAIKGKKRGPAVKAMVYRTLALTAASQGHHDEAVDLLKKALAEVPDNKGLQEALKYELHARDKNKGEIMSNPKVDVLLEALGPGKTWDESISYLEDKLEQEQNAKKKQSIRDAIVDAKRAAAIDNRRQYDEHMQKVDEFLKKGNKDSAHSEERFLDILESSEDD